MKRFLTTFLFWLLPFSAVFAGGPVSGGTSFSTHFQDSTLRLDYVFCGDASHQAIYLRQVFRTSVWAGRHAQLTEPLLRGNGQIRLLDPSSGVCLYAASFSSLFQEWVTTEEATRVQKAFENSFQLPFPKHPVTVEITLRDTHGKVSASLRHPLNPADILIRPLADNRLPMKVVHGDVNRSRAARRSLSCVRSLPNRRKAASAFRTRACGVRRFSPATSTRFIRNDTLPLPLSGMSGTKSERSRLSM